MRKSDLHPKWYLRLLLLWPFTGLPVLVLSNLHNPNWFSVLPSPPPFGEGAYATIAWTITVLIIWQPVLLLPFWLWSRSRRQSSKVGNA